MYIICQKGLYSEAGGKNCLTWEEDAKLWALLVMVQLCGLEHIIYAQSLFSHQIQSTTLAFSSTEQAGVKGLIVESVESCVSAECLIAASSELSLTKLLSGSCNSW